MEYYQSLPRGCLKRGRAKVIKKEHSDNCGMTTVIVLKWF